MQRGEPRAERSRRARLAVVGDVHLWWGDEDVEHFDSAGYDAVLFVGDLCGYSQRPGLRVARSIARMRCPALVLPGNHDGVHLVHLAAEVFGWFPLAHWLGGQQARRCRRLDRALGEVPLCGYSLHSLDAAQLTIIAARPHAMGGPRLAFERHLRRAYGVGSLAQSADRLRALVDDAPHDRLVFLAHNGPTGLGRRRHDIFGCDFRPEEGDWGDPDLREAIDHAREQGKRVLAVAAGHMHHRLKGGGHRNWQAREHGTLYVNAARVPRVFEQDGRTVRHHVRLEIHGDEATATEVRV